MGIIILQRSLINNEYIFGANAASPHVRSQRVLASKRSLRGLSSAESEIRPDGTVIGGAAFVTTADWPNGSPLDVGPVETITINGGQDIDHGPEDVNNPAPEWPGNEDAAVADAVKISTLNPRLRNARIRRWRGTGARLTWPTGTTNPSAKNEGNVIEE